MFKILICGSRDWTNEDAIRDEILEYTEKYTEITIIQGECRGADLLAKKVAKQLGLKVECYHPDWNKYGKAAGPMRNSDMLNNGKPNIVLAFHNDINNSKGTLDMINKAKQKVPVYIISEF